MESHFIEQGAAKFHYLRMGKGAQPVICLHGYGETAAHFELFEPFLGELFTLYAIDAPYHGKTEWTSEQLFAPEELVLLIDAIIGAHVKFTLFGYSMGGRMALKMVELVPERLNGLVLIAPDGLHKNKWQWFATQTKLGNGLFKLTMQHPHWFFWLLKIGERTNLLNKSIVKFVHHYLDDPHQREELYKRWTNNRRYRPRLAVIKVAIAKYKVRVQLLFGKYDRVIITKRGEEFAKGLEEWIQVHEIEAGHLLLQPKYAKLIAQFFIPQ